MGKKMIIICIIILSILIIAAVIWWFMPSKIIANDVNKISYIKVGNGSTGKQFTITDKDDISSVIKMLQTTTISKKGFNGARSGFGYTIELYSNDGSLYKSLTILGEKSIVIGPFLYRVQGDTMDLTMFKQLDSK
jgi:uncharacterized membrane protein YqiK